MYKPASGGVPAPTPFPQPPGPPDIADSIRQLDCGALKHDIEQYINVTAFQPGPSPRLSNFFTDGSVLNVAKKLYTAASVGIIALGNAIMENSLAAYLQIQQQETPRSGYPVF